MTTEASQEPNKSNDNILMYRKQFNLNHVFSLAIFSLEELSEGFSTEVGLALRVVAKIRAGKILHSSLRGSSE